MKSEYEVHSLQSIFLGGQKTK